MIGAGFSGMSAACFMARSGWEVEVLEKHDIPGGRARQLKVNGFSFDMGPSWYWMPDVFERFFKSFDKEVSDFYKLKRLDPSYRIYWNESKTDVPANYEELRSLFESIEAGAALNLDKFLEEAKFKYDTGIKKLVFKPGESLSEFLDLDLMKGMLRLDVFTSMKKHVGKFFKNYKLKQLIEFPVLFLGALPENTPALYSLMNYADIKLGTWYPEGGMYSIIKGMQKLAEGLGVKFSFGRNVTGFNFTDKVITAVETVSKNTGDEEEQHLCDVVIASADYHYIENALLPKDLQSYSDKYWETRSMAPSCILYYVGLNKKLKSVIHHSLFFDVNFDRHAKDIYTSPSWPEAPLFYVCTSSVSDIDVAPAGCENLFFLIPIAAGLQGDNENLRDNYFSMIVKRFEKYIGEEITSSIIFKQSFGPENFINDYNAFKGNAYGLANTLMQTANLKPSCRSKKVNNLFYTGQLTVPGPGVPPALISGEVVANQVGKYFN